MSERIRGQKIENFPKFDLRRKSGELGSFGDIPYEITYAISKESDEVSPKNPAISVLYPNIRGGQSLGILIHESVPKKFRSILVFHELEESQLVIAAGMSVKEAHNSIENITEEYARELLKDPRDLETYHQWKSGLIKG
ncbi:MAG: hypothetical protein WC784_04545 [Candidatus Shapirobacteria bacterium]|jgi:hypothetical protein